VPAALQTTVLAVHFIWSQTYLKTPNSKDYMTIAHLENTAIYNDMDDHRQILIWVEKR